MKMEAVTQTHSRSAHQLQLFAFFIPPERQVPEEGERGSWCHTPLRKEGAAPDVATLLTQSKLQGVGMPQVITSTELPNAAEMHAQMTNLKLKVTKCVLNPTHPV